MSNQPLSLAFVGGGTNSAVGYAHFSAARLDNLWSLDAGVFSTHEERNHKAAERYGVESSRLYSSLDELLAHEADRLDAIAVLTPTPLHYEMVSKCLHAGVPVICEKALAITSAEALEIHDICEEQSGFLAVIYNYSGYPMVRELRQIIHDGVLGEVLHFQAEMPQEGYLRLDAHGNKPNVQDWRRTDGPIPTLHLDLAVHLHELIHYLTEEKPLEVVADQANRGWHDVVDNVFCLARYTNKIQGQLWFSKCALGSRNGLQLKIYGSKASAEWYQLNPEELMVSHQDGRREIIDRASNARVAADGRYNRFKSGHPAGFIEALGNLYSDIHHALIQHQNTGSHDSKEIYGGALATEGLIFLEAMVASYRERKWMQIAHTNKR